MSRPEVFLTREQCREIDRRAMDDFAMPGILLMENAGRSAADIIAARLAQPVVPNADRLDPPTRPPPAADIVVVCGAGNNGGDSFVIARHLANRGATVEILLASPTHALTGDAHINYAIAKRMGLSMFAFHSEDDIDAEREKLSSARYVVDAILGTGMTGPVRPPLDAAIQAINDSGTPVIAIDIPSGLDCNTGKPGHPTVQAATTITFVAKKRGFREAAAQSCCGEILIAGIGAPQRLIDDIVRDA